MSSPLLRGLMTCGHPEAQGTGIPCERLGEDNSTYLPASHNKSSAWECWRHIPQRVGDCYLCFTQDFLVGSVVRCPRQKSLPQLSVQDRWLSRYGAGSFGIVVQSGGVVSLAKAM